jgi:hypothetical protein
MGKKGKSNRKRKSQDTRRQAVPDRRLMEQTLESIGALLQQHEFASIEEANAFLQSLLAEGKPLPPPPAETPLQQAQAVIYEALEARGRQRIRLAHKALAISPDCADAYVLLAEEEARSLEQANAYYAQGVEAGRRALGPEIFAEEAGHFWGITQTRPFMRALEGYSRTLWLLGDREASVAHQQELLRLNPGDNQGVRYSLVHCLLELERFDELSRLFSRYPDEISADMLYARALAVFLQERASPRANRRRLQALQANPHVPPYLLGETRLPRQLPDSYGLGDENEAILYVAQYGAAWLQREEALLWLADGWDEVADPGVEADDDEDFEGFPLFRLDHFLAEYQFPKAEHAAIRRSLAVGLGNYFFEAYGDRRYGKQPAHLLDEYLHVPYLFGYGAVEVMRHQRLRPETKKKVCVHALRIMNMAVNGGVPYGLLALAAYMASQDALDYDLLQLISVALSRSRLPGYGRISWLEGATREEVLALAGWIAASAEVEAEEKLWWAWRLTVHSDSQPHTGKAVASYWLSSDALAPAARLALCHAWLENESEVGKPPPMWQINRALLSGEFGEVKRLFAELGQEIPADIADLIAENGSTESRPEPGSVEELLAGSRDWVLTPGFLHRLAIPALVRLGEDLETVVERYWHLRDDYYAAARTAGVADAIREFGERLSPERRRELIDRGARHSLATVRKTFYMLGLDEYGEQYLEPALADNAASLRRWSAKKLGRSA